MSPEGVSVLARRLAAGARSAIRVSDLTRQAARRRRVPEDRRRLGAARVVVETAIAKPPAPSSRNGATSPGGRSSQRLNEPRFILAAAQHLANSRRPQFLFRLGGAGLRRRAARCWRLPMAPRRRGGDADRRDLDAQAGDARTPLLDRRRAGEALDAILDHFRRTAPTSAGLMFPLRR